MEDRTMTDPPMCHECGHFFRDDPAVGRAYRFLYGADPTLYVGSEGFIEDLEECILNMGNDKPEDAAAAVCYALMMGGWPEEHDIQRAVLHRQSHESMPE
jgi:hypothetical protein